MLSQAEQAFYFHLWIVPNLNNVVRSKTFLQINPDKNFRVKFNTLLRPIYELSTGFIHNFKSYPQAVKIGTLLRFCPKKLSKVLARNND